MVKSRSDRSGPPGRPPSPAVAAPEPGPVTVEGVPGPSTVGMTKLGWREGGSGSVAAWWGCRSVVVLKVREQWRRYAACGALLAHDSPLLFCRPNPFLHMHRAFSLMPQYPGMLPTHLCIPSEPDLGEARPAIHHHRRAGGAPDRNRPRQSQLCHGSKLPTLIATRSQLRRTDGKNNEEARPRCWPHLGAGWPRTFASLV